MWWINSLIKTLCVSCWTAYILQDDTRSPQYQVTVRCLSYQLLLDCKNIYSRNSISRSEVCPCIASWGSLCLHGWMNTNYSAAVGMYTVNRPSSAPGWMAYFKVVIILYQFHRRCSIDWMQKRKLAIWMTRLLCSEGVKTRAIHGRMAV